MRVYLISFFFTAIYVVSLYTFPVARPRPSLNRNDPKVITARCISVLLASSVCCILTRLIIGPSLNVFTFPTDQVLKSLLHAATIFIGPLYEVWIVDKEYRLFFIHLKDCLSNAIAWRNIIIVSIINFFITPHSHKSF